MNRKLKIEFLNGLLKGTRRIEEVDSFMLKDMPLRTEFWNYNDDKYINKATGKVYTQIEFDNLDRIEVGIIRLVVFKNFGQPAIAEREEDIFF